MGRAPCCDKANVKKGPWSPEEDVKLKAYIEMYGTGNNWIALPQKIGLKRCGKSCRLRWLNYLRPNIKHGGFSEEEDNIICSLYISIGSRWSVIAAQLPGRTDNDIKNYWNTRLKKKLLGRRKQSNINWLSSGKSHDPKDSNDQEDKLCAPVLSNSALERLQLHIQLRSLQNPLSFYDNPALWPKLHPLQEKTIQSLQILNQSTNSLIHEQGQKVDFHESSAASLVLQQEQDVSAINSLDITELENSLNGLEHMNAVSPEDLLINNKTVGFPTQEDNIAEFSCFKEMDGSKDCLSWWFNNDFESKSASNSWDSASVLQSEGMYQEYELGYNLQ